MRVSDRYTLPLLELALIAGADPNREGDGD